MQGQTVGNWIIEAPVDEGGMGVVWRGRHNRLQQAVAVKIMHAHLTSDAEFSSRFEEEAAALARLRHPHIVGLIDFFPHAGTFYLVMPFIEGLSVEQRLLAQPGPMPMPDAMRIARDILQALDYAHQQAVIHRDVKPSNILLDRAGHAYLADFGIALRMGQRRRTSTGRAIGTAHYMSPEQIRNPRILDHRTDVYSFGCVLYEMLTGKPPFHAQDEEGDTDFLIKEQHLKQAPVPPRQLNSQIPETLEAIVLRAMAKHPDERFSGCGEFARALAQLEKGELPAIPCPHCGTPNRLASPALIFQTNCSACQRPMAQPPAPPAPAAALTPKNNAAGWKLGLLASLVLGIAACIGWAATYDQLERARQSSMGVTSGLQAEEEKARLAQTELEKERNLRLSMAEKWPVNLLEVKLRNESKDRSALSQYTTVFSVESAKYISWYATLQNQAAGIKSLEGSLKIKYFKPDGSLMSGTDSPSGYTHEQSVSIAETGEVSLGQGCESGSCWSAGEYRIEFWWDGKKIGDRHFTIE